MLAGTPTAGTPAAACGYHPAGTYLLACGELPGGAMSSGGRSEEMLCFGECRVDSRLMEVICGESGELGLEGVQAGLEGP